MRIPALGLIIGMLMACSGPPAQETTAATAEVDSDLRIATDVQSRLAQFAPTEIRAELAALSESERLALADILQAARFMNSIFLRQAWSQNPDLAARLESAQGPLVEPGRTYFEINFGPWDRLASREPFIGDRAHPPGAGYYPPEMTKQEFEQWIEAHPEDEAAFESLITVIRRRGEALVAEPYSDAFAEFLEPAAADLEAAAAKVQNASLKEYLRLRAEAFRTDDYYQSDLAWMDLDSALEVTIGPYEVYEDELFGYKAAFESFVTVALPEASAALERFKSELPALERNLPIPEKHKNSDRGSESPIRVVDLIFNSGDARAGVQTIAFNLPNDERVREAKGSKKVLLRNVMRAKYDQILAPIASAVLSPEDAAGISFEAYLQEVLHHELSHGLGPGLITIHGEETEVRLALQDLYSTLEEAKADVMGIYNILYLIEQGLMEPELRNSLEPTYVAGLFRSARFGIDEAHGQGVVAQFNYLREQGALEVTEEGRFRAVTEAFPQAIRSLLHEMLMLQATGDYAGTEEFLERYGQPDPALREALSRLKEIPVDIRPLFPQAEEIAG